MLDVPTAPEELRVTANGLAFGALAWGEPDAPLALLLHGYPDTAWTWRELGPHLAEQGWRVVAPFMRGYAPTDLAPSYFLTDLADDAVALHRALGGDDRAVLIGHDWGALAVWTVGQRSPGVFAKLVTLSIPPPKALLLAWRPRTLRLALGQARRSWYLLFNQLPFVSERSLGWLLPRLWRDWSPGFDGRADVARAFDAMRRPGGRRAVQRYYRDNLVLGARTTFTLTSRVPVLHLHGDHDGCITADLVDTFPDVLPDGSRYARIPGAGHFLQLEQPAFVHPLIDEWIGAPVHA